MTIQETKKWLKEYQQINKEIADIQLRMTQLRLQHMAPSAINYSDMPKSFSPCDLSDYYAKLEEFEQILKDKYIALAEKAMAIYQAVDRVEDKEERHVLRRKYLDDAKWTEIADEIPCSERAVYYIHGRALAHISETLQ